MTIYAVVARMRVGTFNVAYYDNPGAADEHIAFLRTQGEVLGAEVEMRHLRGSFAELA